MIACKSLVSLLNKLNSQEELLSSRSIGKECRSAMNLKRNGWSRDKLLEAPLENLDGMKLDLFSGR